MRADLLYSAVSSLLDQGADRFAGHAFESAYHHTRGAVPPVATTEDATWSQVLVTAAVRAALVAVITAAADRAVAEGFRRHYGSWPTG